MTPSIGAVQRVVLKAIESGATLYKDGHGGWYLVRPDWSRVRRVSRESCFGLYVRGLIGSDGTEEGVDYHGGYRVRYALTEQGKRVLG